MSRRDTRPAKALCACMLACLAARAAAQPTYPTRVIRFITPFPPDGSLDPLTRMSAQKLSEAWGQPTVVENRPGGNSIIGTQAVAKAAPDGYTILVAGTPHVINPSLFPTPYDALKDFAPIATIARSRQVLVINPALPVSRCRSSSSSPRSKSSFDAGSDASLARVAARPPEDTARRQNLIMSLFVSVVRVATVGAVVSTVAVTSSV